MSDLIPGGAQTLSKMRGRFPGAYPRELIGGAGSHVWNRSGRTYIDWSCALGAVSLGYHNAAVDKAVREQVERGPIFSLPDAELEARVAQRLVDLIPCAEAVRYVKTGSEATEAAIRVARAATRRDVVLTCGYHGWHSWYAATRKEHPYVPQVFTQLALPFRYNDLSDLDRILTRDIAAIILEPTLIERPTPGFLEGVRKRATRIGAVLIFDEMVTGFRWHAGGAQALFGMIPDLACFGKGMGNGYPIAALVGRADLMNHAVLVSGTFNGDCIALAAADATLARYQQGGVCEHMREIGTALMRGYNSLAESIGVPTRMIGQPPHPVIQWDEIVHYEHDGTAYRAPKMNRHRASLFFQETVKRGVLFHPEGINVMLAHTEEDVAQTLRACEEAMAVIVDAIKYSNVCELIEGDAISSEPAWRIVS